MTDTPSNYVQSRVEAYKALCLAQQEMTRAIKDADNPHLKRKYADLASVQAACMPALHKHDFAVFQPVQMDGERFVVTTIFAHKSGAVLECRVPLIIGKNDMQGLGSAITYARRYGLLCMSGVAPEDDDGAETSRQSRDKSRENVHPPEPDLSRDEMIAKAVAYVKEAVGVEAAEARAAAVQHNRFNGTMPPEVRAAVEFVRAAAEYQKEAPEGNGDLF